MGNVNRQDPARRWVAVTPSDTTHLGNVRSIYVGGAGDVNVEDETGNAEVFVGVQAGTTLPVEAKRVYATSTTATSIIALY